MRTLSQLALAVSLVTGLAQAQFPVQAPFEASAVVDSAWTRESFAAGSSGPTVDVASGTALPVGFPPTAVGDSFTSSIGLGYAWLDDPSIEFFARASGESAKGSVILSLTSAQPVTGTLYLEVNANSHTASTSFASAELLDEDGTTLVEASIQRGDGDSYLTETKAIVVTLGPTPLEIRLTAEVNGGDYFDFITAESSIDFVPDGGVIRKIGTGCGPTLDTVYHWLPHGYAEPGVERFDLEVDGAAAGSIGLLLLGVTPIYAPLAPFGCPLHNNIVISTVASPDAQGRASIPLTLPSSRPIWDFRVQYLTAEINPDTNQVSFRTSNGLHILLQH